ncbi:MAG: hypothetical protein RSF86_13645 [Angelakisella sp.]
MKHNITPELAAAFTARAATMGFKVTPTQNEQVLFTVSKQGTEVCQFEKNGAQRYYPDSPFVEERQKLNRLMSEMKQAHDLYADAPPLHATDVKGFRLISEFGDYLLAAKMGKDNEVAFNTWQYTYDRTAVTLGHYYETNYQGAVKDFALRAGLINENQLFTEEELVILHDSCVFRGRNDDEITYDDERKLEAVMEKVESNIPNRIFDHEQEHDRDQDMEV